MQLTHAAHPKLASLRAPKHCGTRVFHPKMATGSTRAVTCTRNANDAARQGGGNKADKADRDNRANQLNPNNPEYQGGTDKEPTTQADRDNRSNQLNPNNPEYQGGKKSRRIDFAGFKPNEPWAFTGDHCYDG